MGFGGRSVIAPTTPPALRATSPHKGRLGRAIGDRPYMVWGVVGALIERPRYRARVILNAVKDLGGSRGDPSSLRSSG